jgi:hypothetical protein
MYRVTPRTVEETYTRNILLGRYGIDQAFSLLVTGSTVTFTQSPMDTELLAADWYIIGGHERVLTGAEASSLISAGYGSLLEATAVGYSDIYIDIMED